MCIRDRLCIDQRHKLLLCLLIDKLLLQFLKIIITFLEIVKAVLGPGPAGGRLLFFAGWLRRRLGCPGCGAAALVQSLQIRKRSHMILFPAGQDLVRVFKTGLVDSRHGPAAGFGDELQGETIGLQPLVHIRNLHVHRVPIGDAEGLQNLVIGAVVCSGLLPCLRDCPYAGLMPAPGGAFNICLLYTYSCV